MSKPSVLDDLPEGVNNDFKRGLKVGVWDIETTGLNADYGYVLCVCVLDVGTGRIHTIRIDDPRNPDKNSDKWVIKEAIKLLDSFDLLVGWYTARFDWLFINSRALKHRLKLPQRNLRRDLWFTSRNQLKIRSNRLAVVAEFLFGKSIKNAITPDMWNGAIRGDKKALNYVVKHCHLDLHETLRVYKAFMPLLNKRLRK